MGCHGTPGTPRDDRPDYLWKHSWQITVKIYTLMNKKKNLGGFDTLLYINHCQNHFFDYLIAQWTWLDDHLWKFFVLKYTQINDFLHTTGLLRHQGPQTNKNTKKVFEVRNKGYNSKFTKVLNFSPWFGSVYIMEKAIDSSLKSIKATIEPYIGQTCNLVSWIWFVLILLFQYQKG